MRLHVPEAVRLWHHTGNGVLVFATSGLLVLVELAVTLAALGEKVGCQFEAVDVPSAMVQPKQG